MYRALWELLRPYRFTLLFALILQAIAGLCSLIPLIAISQVAVAPVHQYYEWVIIACTGGVSWLICQTLALYLTHQTDNHLCHQVRLQLLNKVEKLPLNHFAQHGRDGFLQIADRDVRGLHQLTAHAPADITKLIILPTTATLILLWQNALLTVFCLIPLIVSVFLFRQMRSVRYQALYTARNQAMGSLYQQYAELADNPLQARQYPNQSIQKKASQALYQFEIAFKRWIRKIGALSSLTQVGISSTLLSLWVIFGVSLLPAPAPLDQIILFILLISSIAAPVAAMGHGADALNLAVSASERIRQFLTEPDMHYGEKDVIPSQGELKLVQVDVKIGDNPILSNINITVEPNEFIAIVGASGAGKSTLLQLMARYLDPTEGNVLFNSAPLPSLSLTSLNRTVSIVMQNSPPFPCSIRENLQLFAPNTTEDNMYRYLNELNLLSIVKQQPKGLDAVIGRDMVLSGGEAQRLAIARALLSSAPLLLLDEPTSALDPQNAQRVLNLLHSEPRTCVLITHDLSGLNLADRILLLDNGKLIAQGSHQYLSIHSEPYQKLLRALEDNCA
ncbi:MULTISPECIES: ABC transporter ATP-binding protein [unclassified Providencia]|uniref:ABC transporter ATP-binding protein n=1 Tax=unclassified Providencia TaxID=2633465 RepID=UPI0028828B60|nr:MULTISPECIES: ABC transporter ATP-binding protein [unclassified Providencia]